MAQDIRRLCKLLVENDERNRIHRMRDDAGLLVSEERDAAVNAETVKVMLSKGLAVWVASERFPNVLQLTLTQNGLEYVKGSNGYLRCHRIKLKPAYRPRPT